MDVYYLLSNSLFLEPLDVFHAIVLIENKTGYISSLKIICSSDIPF